MRILITGSQGFIGSYICNEFLDNGHEVFGVDNYSKYGEISRPHDSHKNFTLYNVDLSSPISYALDWKDVDHIVAGAAMIGGISYFHKYAYDLLATNERILANTFDLAIDLFQKQSLKKITVLSSSMVFENTDVYPTPETQIDTCPPPSSTYGFQKLASEYFCRGAFEQYGLPYTIIRPFNCVGIGEEEALGEDEVYSGNIKMLMSHILPDLIHKSMLLTKDDKLPILGSGDQVRHYTNGKDIARGIRISIESDSATNEDFNISSDVPTSVRDLASLVWNKIHGCDPEFDHCQPYTYDVQMRSPDVSKAREMLGFQTEVSLDESVDEVISWMKNKGGCDA